MKISLDRGTHAEQQKRELASIIKASCLAHKVELRKTSDAVPNLGKTPELILAEVLLKHGLIDRESLN